MPEIGSVNISNILDSTNTQANVNRTENLKNRLDNVKEDKELLKVCQEFESLFVHMMLKEMRSTIPDGGLTEKSKGREIFQDMYDQELAKEISQSQDQGIGLAKMLYEQMKMGGRNF